MIRSNITDYQFKLNKLSLMTMSLGIIAAVAIIVAFNVEKRIWTLAIVCGVTAIFISFLLMGRLRRYVMLLAIFCLPLKVDVFLYREETNYVQLHGLPLTGFDLLFIFLLFEWIWRLARKKCEINYFSKISIPALISIALSGISIIFSNNINLSLCAFVLFLKSYFIFLYFANNITEEDILPILFVIFASLTFQSFVGLAQYATGSTIGFDFLGEGERAYRQQMGGAFILSRVGGTLVHPNALAMFLNLYIPVVFCTIFMKTNPLIKIFAIGVLIISGTTELLTLSRGGWLSLAVALLIASHAVIKRKTKSNIKALFINITVFGVFAAIIVISSGQVQKRLFEDDLRAVNERVYLLQVAKNVIKSNPFFGVGINSYTSEMAKYDRTTRNVSHNFPFPVHNAFVLFAAECGIFALIAAIWLLINMFVMSRILFRKGDEFFGYFGIGLFCGIIAWFLQSQFEPRSITSNYGVWLNFALIAYLSERIKSNWKEKQ